MQIVIDIPEEIYKASQIIDAKYEDVIQIPLEVIKNGTLLPKGHGDLVDTSYFEHYLRDTYIDSVSFKRAISVMKRLSTIIEADKGSEDKE